MTGLILKGYVLVALLASMSGSEQLSGRSARNAGQCSASNCRLPNCYCAGRLVPGGLEPNAIPQMVLVTFDDHISSQNMRYFMELFNGKRKNPNGCPISATFFVSNQNTDYRMVRELHLAGHEMADHSITHRTPVTWWRGATAEEWKEELGGQLKNLVEKGQIPKAQVRGVRVPFLELGADTQFQVMKDEGFLYDSTFMTGPYVEGSVPYTPAWPFTLDFPPTTEFCDSTMCPKNSYPGMWEVPLNRWMGLDGKACSMMDACKSQGLSNKADTLRYLWKNFDRHYKKNRAPFGVYLHATWFEQGEFKFQAFKEFIDGLLERPDVYLVTMQNTIDWMKNPTSIDSIKYFGPWLANCGKKEIRVNRGTPPPGNSTSGPSVICSAMSYVLIILCLGVPRMFLSL